MPSITLPNGFPQMTIPTTIVNALAVPINLYWTYPDKTQLPLNLIGKQQGIGAGQSLSSALLAPGEYTITSQWTGAMVCKITVPADPQKITIGNENLQTPNTLDYPGPTPTTIIPPDSPRVLVACGKAPNGNILTREQYWKLSSESYMLAPGAKHTMSFSKTSGMQQTTSQQDEVSKSLGIDVSGGWGPVSASLSASLNQTSTTNQQVTISLESTTYETIEESNSDTQMSVMYLKWQLIDVITVYGKDPKTPLDPTIKPISSITLAQSPTLTAGPFKLNTLD